MIIIEGPDNSGKTRLSNRLAKRLDLAVEHSTRPSPHATMKEVIALCHYQLHPRHIILDRVFAIGEYVYTRALKREHVVGDHTYFLNELYWRKYPIIYCRPPIEKIRDSRKMEMEGVVENIDRIVAEYDSLMTELGLFSHCDIIRWDYTQDSFDTLIDKLLVHRRNFCTSWASVQYMTRFKGEIRDVSSTVDGRSVQSVSSGDRATSTPGAPRLSHGLSFGKAAEGRD